jgi:hypothetical protein
MAQFEGTMAWFWDDEGLAARLTGIYKEHFYAIHADRYDYLGDMYVEMQGRFSQGIKGQFSTPPSVCEMMAQMLISPDDKDKAKNILGLVDKNRINREKLCDPTPAEKPETAPTPLHSGLSQIHLSSDSSLLFLGEGSSLPYTST